MTKEEWKTTCIIGLATLAIWAIWHYMSLANDYVILRGNYRTEQAIVEQMEQDIAEKNLEIDELNVQIKELKEVK